MNRVTVVSSDIAAIGYDPLTRVLEVEFKRGNRLYRFEGVPPEQYDAFVNAASVGAYFAKVIKGKYEYREVKGK